MATYVDASRWNESTKESGVRRDKLHEEIAKGTASQRLKKMIGENKNNKDEYDATNKILNMKEEEKEALGQRISDQYPKGTTNGLGQTSRNRAEYGKPVDLPDADVEKKAKGGTVSASRRADGIAQRGKTKGRMC
jgi:predicted transcriptional regulator